MMNSKICEGRTRNLHENKVGDLVLGMKLSDKRRTQPTS